MGEVTLVPAYKCSQYLNSIARWRNDKDVKPNLRTSTYTSISNQENWIEGLLKDATRQYFFIFEYGSEFIGYCGLDKIHQSNRTAEISLLISPERKNNGHGKIAVRKLLEIAFYEFNLNLVFADINGNTSNDRFWGRCGFKQDGVLRERKFHKGKYYNSIIMSITQEEFWGIENE